MKNFSREDSSSRMQQRVPYLSWVLLCWLTCLVSWMLQVRDQWVAMAVPAPAKVLVRAVAIMAVTLVVRRLVQQAAITHVLVVAMASKSINSFMGQMPMRHLPH